MINSDYLKNLNNAQKEAVLYLEGPLLIVAGAGSGKTKVLTSRIAHIIKEKKAFPNQILSVTFTNKAAKEMQTRVSKMLGSAATGLSWLGTFHSICAKILRKHATAANLNSNFTIIDTDDQTRLIKNICKSENIDIKQLAPRFILAIIDRWKNKGYYPSEVIINKKDIYEKTILPLYKIYQQKLIDLNSCDFGDLILHTVKILENYPDIRQIYTTNFKYILVDEYQDTNFIQSKWLNLLSEKTKNLCCVGDDDQSIYSWRGAEIKNFLEFDQVYENTKVIRLEQNYRSSQNILSVASNLISNNQNRVGKTLTTTMEEGDLVKLNCFKNGKDEAIGISDEIEKKLKKKYSFNEMAILVRAIFQTREFEERFLKIGMPYRILGGTKFYERAEIKDCVAYLRLIHQEKDDLAFERIVNNPKRSIGDTTLKTVHEFGKANNLSLESAANKMIEQNLIKPKTKIGLSFFLNALNKWRNDLNIKKVNHIKLLQIVLDESGYSAMLKNKKDLDNENRLENIKELLSAMKEFDNLESFLEHVSLATSIDQEWDGEKINMMTMHAAKGLEFDVVFLPGWEEGLFPHQKSIEEKGQNGLEEERRLAYVGITRAKKKAIISFSMNRFYQGDWIDSMASRFIEELPEKHLEKNSFFEEEVDDDQDFDFNQDFEIEEGTRSPGWIRYQKRIK
ncbi:UvrD-helicase domain-containing protein [Candidatus Pelagibacter sp.]|jgi:DNA helicase-2/ATP-dependent DNA helicase PcrA|nr:UvrD-helicase domain-containing protein [Candidatus Pelagibacter bacterium]MDA9145207.1 UvrD-helicase domain-containing protein [Candidatus Pelagibacter sp.]MDB3925343.1 UvrD-helicase domain-containing protein [Candidatus Pelagibacter sp.]MDB4859221.1 UvrD-helicase domain-containing protein [Candidatus Pelagibacter sp.]